MLSCKHRIATGNRIMVIEHKRELDFHLGRHPVRQSLHNATSNVRVQKEAAMQTTPARRAPGQETNQKSFLGKAYSQSSGILLFVRPGGSLCLCLRACLPEPAFQWVSIFDATSKIPGCASTLLGLETKQRARHNTRHTKTRATTATAAATTTEQAQSRWD